MSSEMVQAGEDFVTEVALYVLYLMVRIIALIWR